MATSNTKKGLSASILAGSEEIFDFCCQPCSSENLHIEAIWFCNECGEYLCSACHKFHRKLAATKHHTLLDKSSMPKTKPTSKVKDDLTEKCPTHPDKVIEYFCTTHSDLCCSVCLNMNHRNCSMSYIPEVSDEIAGSQEHQQLKKVLEKFISMATGHQTEFKIYTQTNDKYHFQALADIKEFRKNINTLLDKLEQDAVRKVSVLKTENAEKLKTKSEKVQSLLVNAKQMSSALEEKVKLRKNNQLFVALKLYKRRISCIEEEFKDTTKFQISRYVFHQDDKLQEMTSTLSTLWSLSVRQEATDTTARYIRDVNVKSADDKKECNINGIAVLTDDRIVVTDYDNKSVKLVDVKQNKVMCSVSVSSEPFDITVIKEDQVAVTLANVKKIEIFTVSDILTKLQTIDARCVGFEHRTGQFISVDQKPGSVKIIDMSGKVLSTFSTDSNGKPLFTLPRHIALSRDHDVLYVTDHEDHTVTCMTVGGKVISVYKHDKLKSPAGAAVDTDGNVYVCSRHTHTIHQLSPTGTLIQILLGQENGLAMFPCAIAHGDKDGKLYISSASTSPKYGNYVKVFQLE